MLLPQPDSPTIASVSRGFKRERHVVDRLDSPRPVKKHGAQVVTPRTAASLLQQRIRCGAHVGRPSAALPRIENVAQRVAEQVGAEHGQADRERRGRSPAMARCAHIRPPIPTACGPRTDRARECRGRGTTATPRSGWPTPSCAVASTISGASVFGRTCRTAMRNSLMPTARAASTNGSSRSASVLERITRADVGDQRDGDGDDGVLQRRPERRRHDQRQNEQRQRLQDIDQALRREIDPAAEIAGAPGR